MSTPASQEEHLHLYFDDVGIGAQSLKEIEWLKSEFSMVFKIKDLGEMKRILSSRITRDRRNHLLRMNQTHYLTEVLDELGRRAERSRPTEIPINGYDSIRPASPMDVRINTRDYQYAIGKVMYAAIHTRSEIAYATGRLSQFLSDPAKQHGEGLTHLLRYIRPTVNLGLMLGGSGTLKVIGPIAWRSRKQKSVADSTTEAEYLALSSCTREGMWMV